ncbi:MAG: ABC transporter permease, partial [Catenulispora sp.]|nr:ABC transporter permease [Catenulispora sp.]
MRIWTVLRRGLAARAARTAATGIAVAAAVAFLAGSYVLTDTIDASVQRSATDATSGIPVIVTDTRGFGGSGLFGAPTLPPDLVDRIRQIPGVAAAEGVAEGYAMPLDGHGQAVSTLTGIGLSIPADPRMRMLRLATGAWPADPGQIVIDAHTAASLHLRPGDTLRVALTAGARTFTVAGTTTFGGADDIAGLSVVGFTSGAAPGLLGSAGSFAAIEAVPAAGLDPAVLQNRIDHSVGGDYTVRTGAQQAGQLIDAAGGVATLIGTFLRVFAVIALLVAALLIANTFTITVAQRTHELALLRCVGAARNQTARLILTEALLVGAAGGLVGLPGGIGLAAALKAVLGAFGLPLPDGAPVVAAHTVVAALVVGIGVTAAAAGGAAVRASRSRPLTALAAVDTTADAPR